MELSIIDTTLRSALENTTGSFSVASIDIPQDLFGFVNPIDGITFNSHDSHLFCFRDPQGEVISNHNIPRS
jgi:hypothetical protein